MTVADRLDELIAAQEKQFMDRQPRSRALLERAAGSLAGGVTSSWQISRPQASGSATAPAAGSGTPTATSTWTCTVATG